VSGHPSCSWLTGMQRVMATGWRRTRRRSERRKQPIISFRRTIGLSYPENIPVTPRARHHGSGPAHHRFLCTCNREQCEAECIWGRDEFTDSSASRRGRHRRRRSFIVTSGLLGSLARVGDWQMPAAMDRHEAKAKTQDRTRDRRRDRGEMK